MKTELVKLTTEWEAGSACGSRGDGCKRQLHPFDPVFLYLRPPEEFRWPL